MLCYPFGQIGRGAHGVSLSRFGRVRSHPRCCSFGMISRSEKSARRYIICGRACVCVCVRVCDTVCVLGGWVGGGGER